MSLPTLRHPGDLDAFIAALPAGPLVGVEVGTFRGAGAAQLLASGKFATLYCVDEWRGGYDPDDLASGADMEAARADYAAGPGRDPRVVTIRAASTVAAGRFAYRSLDVVYLDADHRYVEVVKDLLAWQMRVKPGGIIAGHDYGRASHPGVKFAVDDVIGVPDMVFGDSSWLKRVR
ncbi:MAG TPA: class I SAM-dependent methyltransferase [Gemmata sp.]